MGMCCIINNLKGIVYPLDMTELRRSEIGCVAIWRLLELFEKNMEDKMVDCIKKKRKKAIEKENEDGIFVIGIKVKGNGWEANRAFSDSHEVGRFIKK